MAPRTSKPTASINDEGDTTEGGAPSIFTPREQRLIMEVLLTTKTNDLPSINTHKIAERLGLSNHRSVQNAWGQIKKKIAEEKTKEGVVDSEPEDAAPKTPGKGRKRAPKAKAVPAAGGASDDEDAAVDRVKTGRVTKRTLRKAARGSMLVQEAKNDEMEVDGGGESLIKVKHESDDIGAEAGDV
ncbi:hypothetical protein N0V88_008150 [Collariella sp. IMI 366227]|nr:hypothetical protein N0V88_008150 [Collariella sp. IMI 366227]